MLPVRRSAPVRRSQVVAVEVRLPEDGTWFSAVASSLSTEELSIAAFRELAVGTPLILELSLPSGTVIVADGIVADAAGDPSMTRVQLVDLSPDARDALERYVTEDREETPCSTLHGLAARVA